MKNEVNKEYAIIVESELEISHPQLFHIVMHNDDYTPMEFVVGILERFFYMDRRMATEIMLEVHTQGKAAFGLFTKDVAESKVLEVVEYARFHEHPLVCSTEAAS